MLAEARLISLVGPGGVGKTRLAARLATDLARGFTDGGWWVSLAEVRDPAQVAAAMMTALDVQDQGSLDPTDLVVARLRGSALLLVLDNCEHLLTAAAAVVDTILRAAPQVRVIATSREPLQVPGEYVLPVPPLGLPPAGGGTSPTQLQQNEAVSLFVQRARAATGTFEVTDDNHVALAEVCRRLDGLPLALELAAVRTRVLSPEQILTRLSDRFALLTGGSRVALPRHQTLQTTIDWSHDLLDVAEQRLLRRLCVFAGLFTLDDLEPVCVWDGESVVVLELLSSLVDKSLVTREDLGAVTGFRLHETMRAYAAAKLRDAGEDDRLDDMFVAHYWTRTVDTASAFWRRPVAWLAWMNLQVDNIRLTLQKCLDAADWRRGLDIITATGPYWSTRGTRDSRTWLDQLLTAAGDAADVPAEAYRLRGSVEMRRADADAARPWLVRAIDTARAANDRPQLAAALATASIAENMAGRPAVAAQLLEEADTIAADEMTDPVPVEVIQAKAVAAFFQGDVAAADQLAAAGEQLCRASGDLSYLVQMLIYRGQAAIFTGDVDRSKALLLEALRVARRLDDRPAQFDLLSLLVWPASTTGQARLAAQLLGAADGVQAQAATGLTGPYEPLLTRARETAIGTLGRSGFETAFAAGQRMPREDALRLALGETPSVADADSAPAGPLAPREIDVAQLIAEGLTNKQIAGRLFISDRTVATHVRNIMNKLGFDTRSQIANWVATLPS